MLEAILAIATNVRFSPECTLKWTIKFFFNINFFEQCPQAQGFSQYASLYDHLGMFVRKCFGAKCTNEGPFSGMNAEMNH